MAEKNNKTTRVREYLLSLIAQKQYDEDGRLPTERELCERFGISRVPVNAALSELVSEGVITRVKGSGSFVQFGEEAGSASRIIPFVVSEQKSSSRFLESIRGAETYLKARNHYLTIRYCAENPNAERDTVAALMADGLRSVILSPHTMGNQNCMYYYSLIRKGLHITFLDLLPNGLSANLVACDHTMGGYLAVRHLLDNGYTRIAALYNDSSVASVYERLQGYIYALQEAGLPVRPEYFCSFCSDSYIYPLHNPHTVGNPDKESFAETIDRILCYLRALPEPPDAIFCSNDVAAINVYTLCQQRHIAVPEELAIIGFDDLPETAVMGLSTMEQPFYDIGYHAARLCLSRREAGISRLYLPPRVIARASSAPKKR